MRLGISNIAWDISEDAAIAKLLYRHGIDAIDVAPGKYFPNPASASEADIFRIKNWWLDQGVEITGMQSLLFGTTGLNIFGPPKLQDQTLEHLATVSRIGAILGAKRLVFGSPKNRDRTGLSDQEANDTAISFFRRLGDLAHSYGVFFCLEPNPACYGANFMTTSAETALVVQQTAHAAIRMQFDSGALAICGENPTEVLQGCASLVGHVHASEPNLLPLGDGGTDHHKAATALNQYLPAHIVSIEMVATKDESHTVSIERALSVAIHCYRNVETEASI